MRIILQKDVKDLGKVGDLVSVKTGYARNYLFPRGLATEATESKQSEWNHLKKVAEVRSKKAMSDRAALLESVSGVTLSFQVEAGENEKLFGSITQLDLSKALEKQGFQIDRKDIVLDEPIRILGQHKAKIQFAADQSTEISVSVERA